MKIALIGPSIEIDPLYCLIKKYGDFLCVNTEISIFNRLSDLVDNEYELYFIYTYDEDYEAFINYDFCKTSDVILWSKDSKWARLGLKAHATGFVLLPSDDKNFATIMGRCKCWINNSTSVKCKKGKNAVVVRSIEVRYAESIGHNVIIHMDNEEVTINSTLTSISNYLDKGFIRCHRSYLVNMRYIKALDGLNIILKNDSIIPISPLSAADSIEIIKKYMAENSCYLEKI